MPPSFLPPIPLPPAFFDDNNKKTGLIVGSTAADGVIVDAADIVSTAKTLDGSDASGSVYLIGNGNKNEISAGKHGSTLYGGKYNVADKLIGGDGADVFEYSAGDGADVISNFDGKKDYVLLNGVTELKSDNIRWSGDKIVVTIGKGSITIKDAPRGTITVEQSGGTVTYKTLPTNVTYKAAKSVVTLTKDFSGTLVAADLGLPVKEINGSAATGTADIRGMSTATKITASKGGSTLTGGAGNDTLVGGSGKDVFVVTGGSQLPTSEEEYWFMQSETSTNELDALGIRN